MCTYESNDHLLVSGYLKGNERCLELLIQKHQQRIYTSIIVLVKDKELAEDIFQDTFIKVIKTLRSGRYKEEGKFLPWVIRIAHNLVIDHFRKQKRMPKVRDTDDYSVLDTLRVSDENVEQEMISEQIRADVRKLVDKLPFEQREVVIMRHFAEMSFKEISETTGVSINTSLGRMRYALINLRKLIEKHNMVMIK